MTDTGLTNTELVLPTEGHNERHVYHVYAIRSPQRDQLREALNAADIQSGLHYPTPVHLQPAMEDLGYQPGSLPETEALFREELSLPMGPTLTNASQEQVAAALASASLGIAC